MSLDLIPDLGMDLAFITDLTSDFKASFISDFNLDLPPGYSPKFIPDF